MVWQGLAWLGGARRGKAGIDLFYFMAGRGRARLGMAGHGRVRLGKARQGKVFDL